MKKFFSLILAGVMAMSIAACNKKTVENVENSDDQQQEVNNDNQGGEIITPEDSETPIVENPVQVLNIQLPAEKGAVSAENTESVLKLTVSSEGDIKSRPLPIKITPIDIPSGCVLQYDVYLETAVSGMGIFDVKMKGGSFMADDSSKVDSLGVGLNVSTSDISNYAYNRWYRREFPLHNDGSVQTLSSVRFVVGGLTNGCTNICYFDNIRIVDANGNIVFAIDEEAVANGKYTKTGGVAVEFEVVDVVKPAVESMKSTDYTYILDSMGTLTGSDKIEWSFTMDSVRSAPAIYFGEKDDTCLLGIRGYILTANNGYLKLYKSAETLTEYASKVILGLEPDKEVSIRFELDGNLVQAYWLDDVDGVEPWPEFTMVVEDLVGKNYGFMDLYSYGYTLNTLSHGTVEHIELESYYVNPVILDSADPDILYYDGVYYLYNTSTGYNVYTSVDLINWEHKGNCIDPAFTWAEVGRGYHWAPDIEYYNGKFYMICSVDGQLGIAVADSPLGPFVPAENRFFDVSIDGHLYIDNDGQAYLYYVRWGTGINYGIYGVKIDLETLQLDLSTEVLLIDDGEKWECYDALNNEWSGGITEGPYILKHNGLYYLTYSGSDYQSIYYAMGYAVSESPLGPFTKYEGSPIHIGNANVTGTAHHCFVRNGDGDEFLIFYHNHYSPTQVGPRHASLDKARFAPTESGIDRLETYGPTTTAQPMPLN